VTLKDTAQRAHHVTAGDRTAWAFSHFTHQLRRTLGTLLSRNDARLTADTLGHRRPATTLTLGRYRSQFARQLACCGPVDPTPPLHHSKICLVMEGWDEHDRAAD
jgi:integrase